ncbi:hypothetical protein PR048_016570 [Dryococelus australis]|uniref:DUF5641 domain-containing protein n=1 Tax=Dryococelus australis TaxID=614101 RepID=A0ABQ9HK58_9NEOP|nr:hypothetical protein PR048_016570 [Dryococelus australis]
MAELQSVLLRLRLSEGRFKHAYDLVQVVANDSSKRNLFVVTSHDLPKVDGDYIMVELAAVETANELLEVNLDGYFADLDENYFLEMTTVVARTDVSKRTLNDEFAVNMVYTTLKKQWKMTLRIELPSLKNTAKPNRFNTQTVKSKPIKAVSNWRQPHTQAYLKYLPSFVQGGCCLHTKIHKLYKCPKFDKQNTKEQFSLVKQHIYVVFELQIAVSLCEASHHTLLHFEQKGVENMSPDKSEAASAQMIARVFLDIASQVSFITEGCIQRLGQQTPVMITPCDAPDLQFAVDVFVFPCTTNHFPSVKLSQEECRSVAHMKLAHPSFDTPRPDYVAMGHVEKAPEFQLSFSPAYYIPNHCVITTESSSSKLCVVFDASSKSSTGVSLNDTMLMRLSGFTADIKHMYRQIFVCSNHQNFQRIVWCFDDDSLVEDYRLKTVPYEDSSSQYLAIRTLHVLQTDMYVDDVVSGSSSVKSALVLQEKLIALLAAESFKTRKATSNPDGSTYELHGFCGSLKIRYAAVTYLCITNNDDSIVTYLLAGKSKVALVRTKPLTRLKLCGTLLLPQLIHNALEICNTADCASRDLLPTQLINHPLWWTGPSWSWAPSDHDQRPVNPSVLEHKVLLLRVQSIVFQDELAAFRKYEYSSPPIHKLSPFIDKASMLRVGRRHQNSDLPFEQKHTVLLPKSHPLTNLKIRLHYYETNHQPGLRTLQGILREQFWILSDRHAISRLLHHCVQCWKARPSSCTPVIGNLPAFSRTGVDYAGPFSIKPEHKCFIARRGRLSDVYSDCETNFVRAHNPVVDLQQLLMSHSSRKLVVDCHLSRVIGKQILTFKELYTMVVQVEAILNWRPVCPLSSDANYFCTLTPGHFLKLERLVTMPEPDLGEVKENRLQWHHNYLHILQQRSKWKHQGPQLRLNQLVLIKEDHIHFLQWHLGRVAEFHPGSDGVARVATVRTSHELIKRPAVKLCPLRTDNLNIHFKVGGMFGVYIVYIVDCGYELGLFVNRLLATLHTAGNFPLPMLATLLVDALLEEFLAMPLAFCITEVGFIASTWDVISVMF